MKECTIHTNTDPYKYESDCRTDKLASIESKGRLLLFSQPLLAAEFLGTVVFAITGALAATGKRIDIFGVMVLAVVTAVGGGTIRDLTINNGPIFWLEETWYISTALIAGLVTFILARYLRYPRRLLLIFDAAGISLFAIIGAQKAQMADLSPLLVVMMACITAVAGGLIRDVLTNEDPMILGGGDGELYATCTILGAMVFVLGEGYIDPILLSYLAMLVIFLTRLAAIFGNLRLPKFIDAGHRLESHEEARNPSKDSDQ
ncbi:trimeric intracellular cation channel family protein [Marinobacterium sp. xm-d-510]|uniref:trimeric intracellular cation channel family protein n=1 Tax=unclassified Marinobacterium TaxID=2644139 RepID=UPI001A00DC44|nr:hypothetical protein [Marinobacterium sp. xm-a-152]NRP37163.1 hypothetical protein [Marinobacterium sp. xm-d-579]NRP57486.1 hypothetical protein [Marinobacterium sp. xm-d-510]NRQ02401.1 hypothetical protein [Marinobacterium sp. xm-d-530]